MSCKNRMGLWNTCDIAQVKQESKCNKISLLVNMEQSDGIVSLPVRAEVESNAEKKVQRLK